MVMLNLRIFIRKRTKIFTGQRRRGGTDSVSLRLNKAFTSALQIAKIYLKRLRKDLLVRIYARHIETYQSLLDSLPEDMKKSVVKAGNCKRLTGISECSPTCHPAMIS